MTYSSRITAFLVLVTALLAGCGGGSGGGTLAPAPAPTPPPLGGIEGSGIALGTISGFGSVIVNGVRFNTDAAQIIVDGDVASEADLSVGDVVVVVGSVDTDGVNGTADTVRLDHVVEGPVSAVDVAARSFVVFGQTVRVDDDTVFDDSFAVASIDGLSVGQRVEVSGFFAGGGEIIATRIEEGDVAEDLELSGIVAALDTGASTFEINGQAVEYSGAVLDDFPTGGIADGQLVEVYASGVDGSGQLTATRVEYYDELDDFEDGDELDIEGLITRFVSATDFDVAGVSVTTDNDTEFDNGSLADLALNVRLEVEGELNGNGVLVAEEIEFLTPPDVELAGLVEAIDDDSLVVLGLQVNVDNRTSFEDNSDADVTRFGLADIRVGDYLEIRGRATDGADNALLARRIERDDVDDDDDDGDAVLEGAVDSVMEPALVVLGVTVETDASTLFFVGDAQVTATEFFAQVAAGSLVEVEGELIGGGAILAEEIELELEDD